MLVDIPALKCNSLIMLEEDGLTSSKLLLVNVKMVMKFKELDTIHMKEVVSHVIRVIVESLCNVAFSIAVILNVRQTIALSVKTHEWVSVNKLNR